MPGPNEVELLRDSITSEVNNDAKLLSEQVFNQRRPDVAFASNQEYDDLVHQKALGGDRQWLASEAQRDPNQFVASMERLEQAGRVHFGAPTPPPQPPMPMPLAPATPPTMPLGPVSPPVPVSPPGLIPAAGAPLPQLSGPPVAQPLAPGVPPIG